MTIGLVVPPLLREKLFSPSDLERLQRFGTLNFSEQKVDLEDAIELCKDAEIGIGSWGTPTPSPALLAACPHLKLWIHAAGSVKGFWNDEIEKRNLMVASCAPAIATSVAEMVLGEIIVGLKRVLENGRANRDVFGSGSESGNESGNVPKPNNSITLPNARVGVIGASQVGRRVVENLRHFGAQVWVYDPFLSPEEAGKLGVQLAKTPLELCQNCHAVTLHTPPLPSTRGIVGRAELQAMPDDCVFVNASRGMCVDEAALIEELQKGRLFAFVDVTEPEPAAPDSPLRELPNVVLTSHIAGGPDFRIGKQVVDDVEAFLNGQKPQLVVTRAMLERMA